MMSLNKMKFIIPTLGRIDNQITYHQIPQKYLDDTYLVVQDHEYGQMTKKYPNANVLCLPETIRKLAPTREWIHNRFKDHRYFVFDDDLQFIHQFFDDKWKNEVFTEEMFDDMLELVHHFMDDGYIHGGLKATSVMPTLGGWPHSANSRIFTNVFYDGPNVPDNIIQWNRVPCGEDFDVNLQLLTRGYPNMLITKYCVAGSATNAPGGCETYRTLEYHNASQQTLADLWPNIVKLTTTHVKSGPWKGETKYGVRIQWKKAYKMGQELLLALDRMSQI